MNDLKPCPFCGGDAEIDPDIMFFEYYGHERCDEAIQCTECSCRIEIQSDIDKCSCCNDLRSEAIAAWNRRHGE